MANIAFNPIPNSVIDLNTGKFNQTALRFFQDMLTNVNSSTTDLTDVNSLINNINSFVFTSSSNILQSSDELEEGVVNLYYTQARQDSAQDENKAFSVMWS